MLHGFTLFGVFITTLLLLAWPLGKYMAKVFSFERTMFDPIFCPLEKLMHRLSGIDVSAEMTWRQYASAVVIFNLAGMVPCLFDSNVPKLTAAKSGKAGRRNSLALGVQYGRELHDQYELASLWR